MRCKKGAANCRQALCSVLRSAWNANTTSRKELPAGSLHMASLPSRIPANRPLFFSDVFRDQPTVPYLMLSTTSWERWYNATLFSPLIPGRPAVSPAYTRHFSSIYDLSFFWLQPPRIQPLGRRHRSTNTAGHVQPLPPSRQLLLLSTTVFAPKMHNNN